MATSDNTTIALRTWRRPERKATASATSICLPSDPEYAAWCRIDLATLLLIRPQTPTDVLEILAPFIAHSEAVVMR